MILSLRVSKEQRKALLNRYPSIKSFLQKILLDTADRIIADEQMNDIEEELKEYHDRRVLNNNDIHKRNCTQATKDKISKTLKEKYKGKKFPLFEETKILIGLGNKGKVLSQETKDAIGRGNTGKIRTEEQRENISLSHTGLKYKKRIRVSKEKVECLA